MNTKPISLLLADDDTDDCIFFKEALEELPVIFTLTTVKDGVQLMEHLGRESAELPDILFLDLNMPRKTGIECLAEIKMDEQLKQLPIVVFSTSLDMNVVKQLQQDGAQYYIRKPGEFSELKKVIHKALIHVARPGTEVPPTNEFIIQPD